MPIPMSFPTSEFSKGKYIHLANGKRLRFRADARKEQMIEAIIGIAGCRIIPGGHARARWMPRGGKQRLISRSLLELTVFVQLADT